MAKDRGRPQDWVIPPTDPQKGAGGSIDPPVAAPLATAQLSQSHWVPGGGPMAPEAVEVLRDLAAKMEAAVDRDRPRVEPPPDAASGGWWPAAHARPPQSEAIPFGPTPLSDRFPEPASPRVSAMVAGGLSVPPIMQGSGGKLRGLEPGGAVDREAWGVGEQGWRENPQKQIETLFGRAQKAGLTKPDDKLSQAMEIAQLAPRAAAGDPIAIAQLAKKAIDDVKERLGALGEGAQAVGREGLAALGSRSVLGAGSHASQAGVEVGESMQKFGKGTFVEGMGKAVEGMSKFSKVIFDSLDGLRNWNEQLMQGNFRFAEFSGAMTQVQVEQELRAMQLSQQRGDAQADTARQQAEAKARLDKALAPFETWWSNFTNRIGAGAADVAAGLLNKLSGEEDEETDEAFKQARADWHDFSNRVIRDNWIVEYGGGWIDDYGKWKAKQKRTN